MDPRDEPASELLARFRTTREAAEAAEAEKMAAKSKDARKKSTRKKKAKA